MAVRTGELEKEDTEEESEESYSFRLKGIKLCFDGNGHGCMY